MKIAITGAGGLVGSALVRQFRPQHEVIALGHLDLDVTNREAVLRFADAARPEAFINCAVLGVDDCEADPERAHAINVVGPAALADAAEQSGAQIVHFSSNYVFDGGAEKVYTIEDEPRPVNVYGRTKLAGEIEVSRRCPRSCIIRTSWVFGRGKSSFLSTVPLKLRSRAAVQAITDIRASTTWVEDLAARVGEILAGGHWGTYHIVNDGVCSHESFAREAARLVGLPESEARRLIVPATEAAMGRRAPRPRHTPMRCLVSERFGLTAMRDWKDALQEYVKGIDD